MIKDYGIEVQKLYLELMLADAEVFVRCQGIFDHTLFDRKLQDAAAVEDHSQKKINILGLCRGTFGLLMNLKTAG